MAVDPVCGMEIPRGSIVSTHDGQTYHFCSERCKQLFDADPQKFTSK